MSPVDHVDTDGKAFVLAVSNEPAHDVVTSLTAGTGTRTDLVRSFKRTLAAPP